MKGTASAPDTGASATPDAVTRAAKNTTTGTATMPDATASIRTGTAVNPTTRAAAGTAKRGLSLIELLAVLALIGILTTITFAGLGDLHARKHNLECAAKLRALSQSALLYASDNRGHLPSSAHSGSSWALALAPYVGEPTLDRPLDYRLRATFRCPQHTDASGWSYGLNVFFELSAQLRYTPAGLPILGSRDSYAGSPATWHTLGDIPSPARTILFAENPHPLADHFMAHQWDSLATARNAVASGRHSGRANYAFVDGHVEMLLLEQTFNPATATHLWHPSLAR